MFISEAFSGDHIPLSFEIFPPKGELPLDEAKTLLGQLAQFDPAFVSVTYSAGGSGNDAATAQIAEIGTQEYGLTTMAHLTCMGATHQSMQETLDQFKERGVQNVLALRGDPSPTKQIEDFAFASDLIPVVRKAGFCVGAAAYPEGHVDCLDLQVDIEHLKAKQDAGAQFLVTQLFSENRIAYDFLERCRAARIRIPIGFGIMPIMSKDQVSRMVFLCGASLPSTLVKLIAKWEDDEESLQKAGLEYAIGQIEDLAKNGVDGIHLYTMNKPEVARQVCEAVADKL